MTLPYRLVLEEHRVYLQATVTGAHNSENALRFLTEVFAACSKSGHTALLLEFAETVAINRGVNVRLFHELAAARSWLDGAGGT